MANEMATSVSEQLSCTTDSASVEFQQNLGSFTSSSEGSQDPNDHYEKVLQAEPEPPFEEIPQDSNPEPVQLSVSAVVDWAKVECGTNELWFEKTALFRKSTQSFEVHNAGLVRIQIHWTILAQRGQLEKSNNEAGKEQHVPFTVTPREVIILPRHTVKFQVTYRPTCPGKWTVNLRGRYACFGSNLVEGTENEASVHDIQLIGTTIHTLVHLDVEDSDYLSGHRRAAGLPGSIGATFGVPIESSTRVIEMYGIGLNRKIMKSIRMVNLVADDLEYVIRNEDQPAPDRRGEVTCLTEHGRIASGGMTNATFAGISSSVGVLESFWRLCFAHSQFSIPILLVLHTREPNVTFNVNHVNFGSLLVGERVVHNVKLVNDDAEPFTFMFRDRYGHTFEDSDLLQIEPLRGEVPPNSEKVLTITYVPRTEGDMNNKLQCYVQYTKTPLELNLKAVVHKLLAELKSDSCASNVQALWNMFLGGSHGEQVSKWAYKLRKHYPTLKASLTSVDFDRVLPGESVSKTLILTNCGRTDFQFSCTLIPAMLDRSQYTRSADGFSEAQLRKINGYLEGDAAPKIQVDPNTGSVSPGDAIKLTFKFTAPVVPCEITLDDMMLACLVVHGGPVYGIRLLGRSVTKLVEFSSRIIDFGSRLIDPTGTAFTRRCLYLTSTESSRTVKVTCSPIDSSEFRCDFTSKLFQPNSLDGKNNQTQVWIQFHPQKCQKYRGEMKFTINETIEQVIKLRGQGVSACFKATAGPLIILSTKSHKVRKNIKETKDAERRRIHLGCLKSGQKSIRYVTLTNESAAPVLLRGVTQSPSDSKNEDLNLGLKIRICEAITVERQINQLLIPETQLPVLLKPGIDSVQIRIDFCPEENVARFDKTIICEVDAFDETGIEEAKRNCSIQVPVFTIHGSCEMHQASFRTDILDFGPVVCGSSLTKSLLLNNKGSTTLSFQWAQKSFGTDITVFPTQGVIAPHSDYVFEVTLSPTQVNKNSKAESLRCQIIGGETLYLEVRWECTAPTEIKEVLHFTTPVRWQQKRQLPIVNRTNAHWRIKPQIRGSYWSGRQILEIGAQESSLYELTYQPLVMTSDGTQHEATVFFPIPDGTGLLYRLRGTALPPKPLDPIQRTIQAKTWHTELINVSNWLSTGQCFKVTKEIMCSSNKEGLGARFDGANYIEVPGNTSREYELKCYIYREETVSMKASVQF